MSSFKDFRAELNDDATFARFRSIFSTCQKALNIERMETEIRAIHGSRPARSLSSAKISVSILHKAIVTDLSARSRLIEVKLLVHRTEELLSVSIKNTRKYVVTAYRDELADVSGPTKADRDATLDRLMSVPVAYLSSLSSLSEQIELIVKDIDQASFGLRNAVILLQMQLDRKESEL